VISSSKAEGLDDRLAHAVVNTATLIDESAGPDMVSAFYSNIPSASVLFRLFVPPSVLPNQPQNRLNKAPSKRIFK
jgi:hypothetical protein